jgi:hypothetical protein
MDYHDLVSKHSKLSAQQNLKPRFHAIQMSQYQVIFGLDVGVEWTTAWAPRSAAAWWEAFVKAFVFRMGLRMLLRGYGMARRVCI